MFAISDAATALIVDYGHLEFKDISEAYRLAFMDKLGVKGFDNYGEFNLGGFYRIMGAYARYLKKKNTEKTVDRIILEDIEAKERSEKLHNERQAAFELKFDNDLNRYANEFKTYKDVYGWLFELCFKHKKMKPVLDFMDEARELRDREILERTNDVNPYDVIRFKKDPVTVIAEKLAVMDLLMKIKKQND